MIEATGAVFAALVDRSSDRWRSLTDNGGLHGGVLVDAAFANRPAANPEQDPCWIQIGDRRFERLLTVPVLTDSGRRLSALLGFGRAGADGVQATMARLRPLLGRMQPFLRLWCRLRAERSRSSGLRAALDQQDVGVFVLANGGQVLFANREANAITTARDGLRRREDAVTATALRDAVRLQVSIEHLLSASERGIASSPAAPILLLERETGRPLVAVLICVDGRLSEPDDPAVILFVLRPERNAPRLLAPLCRLLGLSPVETRLVGHLVGGMTICEAAAAMRIKHLTARAYLKQVFLKTGARRQAELIRMMMASLVPIGAGLTPQPVG